MDASAIGPAQARDLLGPGRFTRVFVENETGQLEARLSQFGNWELHIRPAGATDWRLACRGDLDSGALSRDPEPVGLEEPLVRGPLRIDPAARTLTVSGAEVHCPGIRFTLLVCLAKRPERVVPAAELMQAAWGNDDPSRLAVLRSHVNKLRVTLARAGAEKMVINSWGVGWRLWDRPDLEVG
ncbi:MAG TPA: winged helix-turn-helix domain-containing protein [Solirubrobacterales bacterium]|nr:winged helix-turn-helix domain-containing protein [Solirubrobacterales bacterium]